MQRAFMRTKPASTWLTLAFSPSSFSHYLLSALPPSSQAIQDKLGRVPSQKRTRPEFVPGRSAGALSQ